MSSPETPKASVHFHSLGCPKNLLDTEVMLGALATQGYALAERLEDADVAVVNTCAFIESAREESIQAILDVADLREEGSLRALVVTGCMPQRYGAELAKELPEVDAFVGTGGFPAIAQVLDDALAGHSRGVYVEGDTHLYDDASPRVLTGPGHSAYVKIAEGCDRVCAFCAIPGIRGRFQSRTLESLVAEAEQLAAAGVRELNLVAQDSTSWGKDLPPVPGQGRRRLADLIRALDRVEGIDWIRPALRLPDGGQRRPARGPGLGQTGAPLRGRAAPARERRHARRHAPGHHGRAPARAGGPDPPGHPRRDAPDHRDRGLPRRDEADFEDLLAFVRESRFDRLGVFRYSDEEDTAGFDLEPKVPREVARDRYRRLTALQQEIMTETLGAQLGAESTLLIDQIYPGGRALGRLPSQAPEIDGVVWLEDAGNAQVGDLLPVRLTKIRQSVDLEAERT